MRDVRLLHARLDEALSMSGGLQQSSQGQPEDDKARLREEMELEDAVADIAAAILGRDASFGTLLPYPPPDEPLRAFAEQQEGKVSPFVRDLLERLADRLNKHSPAWGRAVELIRTFTP